MLLWSNILLAFLGGILTLRLVFWQFLPATESFFREEFSNTAVAVLILLSGIIWLITKILTRQPFRKSGLELPVFLLFAAAAGSLFYAPDLSSSLKGVLVLGAEITFFYMLLDLLDAPSRLCSSLIFLLGLTFVVSVYGIMTFVAFSIRHSLPVDRGLLQTNSSLYYLLVHHRAISFLGWPNALAGYLLLFLPLTLILPLYLKLIWQKYLAAAIMFAVVVCFFYTFTFLSWFSFILSFAVFLPFFWEKLGISHWPEQKKRMIIYALLAFLLFFLLVILRKDFWGALLPRLFYYKASFLLLIKNPVLGYGWGSFGILCRRLTEDTNNLSAYVHNSYLQIWLETGIVGFVGILLLVLRVLRFCHPRMLLSGVQSRVSGFPTETFGNDNVKTLGNDTLIFVAIAWGLVAFFIDNLFNFTLLAPNVAIYWWTMLAVFCAMAKMDSRQKHSGMTSQKHSGMTNVALRMTVFIILLVMFIVAARFAGGYMLYYKAMKTLRPGSFTSSLEMLNQAKVLDPWSSYLPAGSGSIHLAEYGQTRLKNFLKLAAIDYLEAVDRSPKVYYNYFVLGKIFEALGDNVRSQLFSQKAKALSPAEFTLDNIMFHKSG